MQLNPTTSEKRTGYVNRNGIVSWSFVKKKRNKEHVRSKTMSRRPHNQVVLRKRSRWRLRKRFGHTLIPYEKPGTHREREGSIGSPA